MPVPAARRGFTLIELLVVVAIIALLAAILFPVFARVREQARKTTCQSNLKQISLGFQQYTSDYDERLPHAADIEEIDVRPYPTVARPTITTLSDPDQQVPSIWPAKILPYLKSRQIFTCPSRSNVVRTSCSTPSGSLLNKPYGWAENQDDFSGCGGGFGCAQGASLVSYGYNAYYLGGGQIPSQNLGCMQYAGPYREGGEGFYYNSGKGAREITILNPSATLLLVDNGYANVGNATGETSPAFAMNNSQETNSPYDSYKSDFGGDYQCNADNVRGEVRDSVDPRHSGGMNIAYVDGHVKWLKKEVAMWQPAGINGCNNVGPTSLHFSTDIRFIWNRY